MCFSFGFRSQENTSRIILPPGTDASDFDLSAIRRRAQGLPPAVIRTPDVAAQLAAAMQRQQRLSRAAGRQSTFTASGPRDTRTPAAQGQIPRLPNPAVFGGEGR